MRREFVQQIVNLVIEIPKDLIQGIHTELTREPSAYQNQEVDESFVWKLCSGNCSLKCNRNFNLI